MNTSLKNKKHKVAIIDIVGKKAGMNYYSSLLAKYLTLDKKHKPFIFSNFYNYSYNNIKHFEFFKTIHKPFFIKPFFLMYGFIKSYHKIKTLHIKNIIFHIFSYNIIIYKTLRKLKKINCNIILIVHDIETLESRNNIFFQKKILEISSHIVVHNQFSKHELNKIYTPQKTPIVIPHGNFIDIINHIPKNEAKRKLNLDLSTKYLLFFGQIKDSKGLEILLYALPKVRNNVKLIIAGNPWKTNIKKYDKIIEKLKLSEQIIRLYRFISDSERDILFNACECNILPYKKIYQSGVLLMSLSYGLPVIASNLEANREIITNNENGLLFNSNNSEHLAEKINFLLPNNNLQNKISTNAILTAQKYSWDKIANSYKNLFFYE
jgi:glycosyltransferase involved in cell wall biosynthesis